MIPDLANKYHAILQTLAAYTQGCFYTRVLFHRDAFHKDTFLHTDVCTDVFTLRCFYTQIPLRTGAFTQGNFFTEELLHIDAQVLLHTDAFTQ